MKYFKVIRGYGSEEFIPIDEIELEKALYAHLTGKVVVFKNGSINGDSITMVAPDWHRAMGWNYTHKLDTDDYAELRRRGVEQEHRGFLEATSKKIQYLINSKQENLIGKNINVELPDSKHVAEISPEVKSLAGKLKV